MAITTTCPNCKALFRLDEEMAGQKVKCQKCQHVFAVPSADANMLSQGASVAGPTLDMEVGPPAAATAPTVTAAPPPPPPPRSAFREIVGGEVENDGRARREVHPQDRVEDRPRRVKRQEIKGTGGGSSTILVLFLVGGGLFGCVACLGGFGGLAYWASRERALPKVDNKDQVKIDIGKKNDGGKKQDNEPPPIVPGAISVSFGLDGQYRNDNRLAFTDPINPEGTRHKLYAVRMEANRDYQIDMFSTQIDSFLVLVDEKNVGVARDDDGAGFPNARITYRPTRTGVFRIEATHCPANINPKAPTSGPYTLTIQRR